jgi:hypothetical protein
MASIVHFGESFDWDQEEQKSWLGQRRRTERKEKRKEIAEAKDAASKEQLRVVMSSLLDETCHDGALEIFESSDLTKSIFDNMIMQAQI